MNIPQQRYPSEPLTILATRGDRIICWKCMELRELRARTEQFERQGYVVTS